MKYRLVSKIPVAVVALALVVSACGGQAQSTASAGGSGSGDIPELSLTYAYPKDWPDLDPSIAFSAEPDILAQIYETLTVFNPDTGELEPGLATSWESNDDGTVWTFHLRDGVSFHDGTPFTAEAVKLTVERSKEIDEGPAYLFAPVETIEAVDDLTVEFQLSSPSPMDLVMGAGWGAYILSPEVVDQPSDWFREGNGSGTGPYMWESYEPGQSAVLTRFPDYWGGWEPGQFTEVLYNLTPDAATREQLILSGDADLTFNPPLQDLPSLSARDDVDVAPLDIIGIQYLLLNMVRPPFDQLEVRQAVLHTFPHSDVAALYGEAAIPNPNGLVPQSMWGFAELDAYPTDLDRARELLAEAGMPDGDFSFEFVYTSSFPEQAQIGELWKASLAEIGITLEVRQISFNALIASRDNPETAPHSTMSYWPPTYASPEDYLFAVFGTDAPGNRSYYSNPEVDELVTEGLRLSATDREAAAEVFIEAQQMILDDAPGMGVVDLLETFLARGELDNYVSRGFTIRLHSLRLEQ